MYLKGEYGNILEHIIFVNLTFWEINKYETSDQIRKKKAPKNDEDPSNTILKILDMRSISMKNMTL